MTKGLLTPFIGALVKLPDFSNLKYNVNGSEFLVGDFLNAIISFVLIAAALILIWALLGAAAGKAKREAEEMTAGCASDGALPKEA